MTPEKKVKIWLKREILKQYPEAFIYMAPGGVFGVKGIPDMLCCIKGLFVAIEVKADESCSLTKMQIYQIRMLDESGAIVAAVKGKDSKKVEAIFDAIRRRIGIIS